MSAGRHPDDARPNRCIACGMEGAPGLPFRGGPYWLATCGNCGLRWTTNPPRHEELATLYSAGFYAPGPARASRIMDFGHAFNNAVRMRELRDMAPGRLLDIGSGRGRFLAAAEAAGWDATGIEFEPGLAQLSRDNLGVNVIGRDAITAEVNGRFDVVTMWHVLEHLPDPAAALERARALLVPDGRLIVSVPNNQSLQGRLAGDAWLHLDIPRHVFHFNPLSMRRLMRRAGLRVERIGHFYPEMEVLGVIQSALNRLGIESDLLYRFAKADRAVLLRPSLIASFVVATALLPVALSWSILAPILRTGASIQVVAGPARATQSE